MTTNSNRHYKLAEEKSFPPSEKETTTILLGGLSATADKLIESALIGLGYKCMALPIPELDAMSCGKEYCDKGLCNPTYFTVGNLVMYLEKLRDSGVSREDILNNYVYILAGSCGPCRFGMYEYEYRYALENAGFKDFRVILFQMTGSFNQSPANSGLKLNMEFFRAVLNAVILSDHLNELKYQIKPYEVEKGKTNEVIGDCIELVSKYLREKKPLLTGETSPVKNREWVNVVRILMDQWFSSDLEKVLKECKKRLNQIKVDYCRVLPVVKITGEFFAQSTDGDGNYKMFQFLEDEGCEIIVEPVSTWIMYLLWLSKAQYNISAMTDAHGRVTWRTPFKYTRFLTRKYLQNFKYNIGTFLFLAEYNKAGKKIGNKHRRILSIDELAKLASKYMDVRYDGGEGFLEVAKNIYYTKNNLAHMVLSIKPFGCMPSTISDAIQVKVVSDYESMIFLPLETSGDGKINALSRVQMALSEARSLAKKEYEAALEKIPGKFNKDKIVPRKDLMAMDNLPNIKGVALRIIQYLHFIEKIH